jgi:type I restriction enzyme S subunit
MTTLGAVLDEMDVRARDYKGGNGLDLPVLSLTKNKGLVLQTERFSHRVATEDVSNYKVVEWGWVVFNPYVLWEGAIHALWKYGAGLVSPVYPVWKVSKADPYYIDVLLKTAFMMETYERVCSGVVKRRRSISKTAFQGFNVGLPGLPEQHAISKALRAVQDARDRRRREVEVEFERKAALMEDLFARGVRGEPLRQTDLGLLPGSWSIMRLGDMAEGLSGGTPSKKCTEWWEGSVPWASPKDMKRPRLSDTQDHITEKAVQMGSRLVPPGTIFVVVRGMILAKDFPVAITEVPMAFNQDMKAFIPRNKVDGNYLLYLLIQKKADIQILIGTSAHGTRRIGTSALESILMPVPPQDEQREIAEVLVACDAKIATLKSEVLLYDELFHALVDDLVTGRRSARALIEDNWSDTEA